MKDSFHIPAAVIREGWDLQWMPIPRKGRRRDTDAERLKLGWVPVRAGECDGILMPWGHRGLVRSLGMALYTRPSK